MLNRREAVPGRSQRPPAERRAAAAGGGPGAAVEGNLMGEGQAPRSAKLARLGAAAVLALCLSSLAASPARAAEGGPAPEPAPPSAPSSSGPEGPRPDATPQAPPPAAARAPIVPATPVAPSSATPPPTSARGHARQAPARPTLRHRRRRAPAITHPRASRPARAHKRTAAAASKIPAPAPVSGPGHRDGTLLLAAALAAGLLALASLSLLRLLTRFGRLSHEGPQ
jgi:DNA polymerase-3 subunit gamma/tau